MRRGTSTALAALREDLREWALWHRGERGEAEQSGTGWGSTTVIGRAMAGHLHHPPGPSMPAGVVPPPGVSTVAHAMRELLASPDLAPYVAAMRTYYLADEDVRVVMREYGLRRRTADEARYRGEHAVLAFLRA